MNDRRDTPPVGGSEMARIEIDFAIPVHVTHDQLRRLDNLLNEIVRAPYNQPADGVHWVSGYGSKPQWSQADAAFLGKPTDTDAPGSGEPTFDDAVYAIETTARPFVSEKERRRVLGEERRDG